MEVFVVAVPVHTSDTSIVHSVTCQRMLDVLCMNCLSFSPEAGCLQPQLFFSSRSATKLLFSSGTTFMQISYFGFGASPGGVGSVEWPNQVIVHCCEVVMQWHAERKDNGCLLAVDMQTCCANPTVSKTHEYSNGQ